MFLAAVWLVCVQSLSTLSPCLCQRLMSHEINVIPFFWHLIILCCSIIVIPKKALLSMQCSWREVNVCWRYTRLWFYCSDPTITKGLILALLIKAAGLFHLIHFVVQHQLIIRNKDEEEELNDGLFLSFIFISSDSDQCAKTVVQRNLRCCRGNDKPHIY